MTLTRYGGGDCFRCGRSRPIRSQCTIGIEACHFGRRTRDRRAVGRENDELHREAEALTDTTFGSSCATAARALAYYSLLICGFSQLQRVPVQIAIA